MTPLSEAALVRFDLMVDGSLVVYSAVSSVSDGRPARR